MAIGRKTVWMATLRTSKLTLARFPQSHKGASFRTIAEKVSFLKPAGFFQSFKNKRSDPKVETIEQEITYSGNCVRAWWSFERIWSWLQKWNLFFLTCRAKRWLPAWTIELEGNCPKRTCGWLWGGPYMCKTRLGSRWLIKEYPITDGWGLLTSFMGNSSRDGVKYWVWLFKSWAWGVRRQRFAQPSKQQSPDCGQSKSNWPALQQLGW